MSEKTHLTRLTFASIDNLAEGQAADAVNRAIERVLADLERFGGDGLTRKIVVEVGIKRRPSGRFAATFLARAVCPGEKTKTTTGYVEREDGGTAAALFATHSATNPDQLTLPLDPISTPEPKAGRNKVKTQPPE